MWECVGRGNGDLGGREGDEFWFWLLVVLLSHLGLQLVEGIFESLLFSTELKVFSVFFAGKMPFMIYLILTSTEMDL